MLTFTHFRDPDFAVFYLTIILNSLTLSTGISLRNFSNYENKYFLFFFFLLVVKVYKSKTLLTFFVHNFN